MSHKDLQKGLDYRNQWRKKRSEEDPTYNVTQNRKWRSVNPKGYMLSRPRSRAISEGIPFTLTVDDFDIPEFCPVFPKLRLEFSTGPGRPDNIPTLDRLVPSLGYVPGNVHVISMRANRLKSDASLEELEALCGWMRTYH